MAALPQIDHVVVNTRMDMDRAAEAFTGLGFTLTERGYHSLGSTNHLMMFGTDYLELIGLPPGREQARPYIAQAPVGLDGLVFKTTDVDAVFAHLQSVGMAGDPPNAFSRPVALPDGEHEARFRTVHVRLGTFPAGRVYFCEHGTPELVWRPEWQQHANGARAMREVVVLAEDTAAEAERFAALLGTAPQADGDGFALALDGAAISVLPAEANGVRFGRLATPSRGRAAWFGAVTIAVASLAATREALAALPKAQLRDEPGRLLVREPTFDTLLEFREWG